MHLSSGSTCIKYLLFIFNLLFVITGIVVLSVGAVIQGVYYNYHQFLDDGFFSVPSLLIAVGSIVLIISFLGCCGAVKENYCMIVSFSITLMLVFILEMSGGIAGYVLRNRTINVLESKLNQTMHTYTESAEHRDVWDALQRELDCCGVYNYTDWHSVFPNESLPMTCCDVEGGAVGEVRCGANSTATNLHHEGCLKELGRFVKEHAAVLGGVGIGIGFIQLVGIILSCMLAKHIKANYENV